MPLIRQILFWTHLAAGLAAGLFIGIMCITGTTLAFENEIVSWAERDARQVARPPTEATRLPLDELQRKLRKAKPDFRAANVMLLNDPTAAIAFSAGRDGGFYLNPYTGEVRQPTSTKVHDFMHLMTDWHRFLGREGEQRPIGKAINGACNLAFFVLAVTGLYLWWPRTWSWRGVKAITLINFKSSGKARDFNWHNAIGLWSAPILIVLTLTAVPISYRWGTNLIYQLVGEVPPAPQGPPAGNVGGVPSPSAASSTPSLEIKRPSPDSRPLGHDILVARIQKDFPRWQQIVLRTGSAQRAPSPAGMDAPAQRAAAYSVGGVPLPSDRPGQIPGLQPANNSTPPREAPPEPAPIQRDRSTPPSRESSSGKIENRESKNQNSPTPLTITIRESASWPRTATTTLTVNPFTGEILKREGFGDFSTGRQIRTWTRFLHTGQALGWPGQLIAGLACLGACFLVYTGFALSWRRFFGLIDSTKSTP